MEFTHLFKSIYEVSPLLAIIGIAIYTLWKKIEKSDHETKTHMERNIQLTRELMGETNKHQEKRIVDLQTEFNAYKEDVTQQMKEKDETFKSVVNSYSETIKEFKKCNTRIAKMEEDISEIKTMVKKKED